MKKGRYYCTHMHMHSNLEGEASIGGHMYEASRTGVEVIWLTDHDTRFGKRKSAVNGFDFEGDSLLIKSPKEEVEQKLQKKFEEVSSFGVVLNDEQLRESRKLLEEHIQAYYGWKPITFENPARSEISLTQEAAFTGKQSMKMTAISTNNDGEWQSAGVVFATNGKRHQHSLLSLVTLRLACLIESEMDKDMRIIIEVKMSQQPPDHNYALLRYVIGEDFSGLSDDYTAVVKLGGKTNACIRAGLAEGLGSASDLNSDSDSYSGTASTACSNAKLEVEPHRYTGHWQELVFKVSEDAERCCAGGLDNVFNTVSIILQTRNGKKLTCFFDDFQISRELYLEELRKRQQQLADQLGKKYGVIAFAANEISAAGQHKISFCTRVPMINYYSTDKKVTHREAVDWVRSHNGILSMNHPFDAWKRVLLDEKGRKAVLDRISENYISSRCDDINLIEIGFPDGRHNFLFEDYLELWDRLSKNGIFITGYGDSDNHANRSGWWSGNNFAAWIYADEPTEEKLTESMKKGNLFTGDPVLFKGTLSFETSEGFTMGQVVKADKPEYVLTFNITGVKPGWSIKWVVDGMRKDPVKVEDNASGTFRDELCLKVSDKIHFVRTEVYDENGRCVVLTNPIYFVSGDDIDIPEWRRANP